MVIDLDDLATDDPARDVASFVVALVRLGMNHTRSWTTGAPLVTAFLGEYRRVRGRVPRNLSVHLAEEPLHRAGHDLFKRVPAAHAWAAATLDGGWVEEVGATPP